MLEIMQKLALCYLWNELGEGLLPADLRQWFAAKRANEPEKLFWYLVEPSDKIEKVYRLRADPQNDDVALLDMVEAGSLDGIIHRHLPYQKVSPRDPQLGPIIKRAYTKAKGPSPKARSLTNTLKVFENIAQSEENWAGYFAQVCAVWNRPKVSFQGKIHEQKGAVALHLAVKLIPDNSNTVFLAFEDDGRLPGKVLEYQKYLGRMLDPDTKYTTRQAPGCSIEQCPLCDRRDVIGYASACNAAGINIGNIDEQGAFPGITNANAHLAFAICADCADLLYIFKYHVLGSYQALIAGQNALLLPDLDSAPQKIAKFIYSFEKYICGIAEGQQKKALSLERRRLLGLLARSDATITIDILWADFGQKMEKLRGAVTDILPSRLLEIRDQSEKFGKTSVFFPQYPIAEFAFDIPLSFLRPLLRRPGQKKANSSKRLFDLKRLLVESLYKNKVIPENRFWQEVMLTARYWLLSILDSKQITFDLLREGHSLEKQNNWWTMAGWIKHLAMAIAYFQYMEVMKPVTNTRTFVPESSLLRPYFAETSGIDDDHKAFAFILGILYGKVLSIQGAKGVNVSANALTWLKRLTLTGRDLPAFFVKVREKLLAYEVEYSAEIREVIRELARLGCLLGNDIRLEQTECCYFLLLGQAVSADVLPSKQTKPENEQGEV